MQFIEPPKLTCASAVLNVTHVYSTSRYGPGPIDALTSINSNIKTETADTNH
jgi:hypothetical protein